ncbi:MAG: PAS domain S-box protein [Syntrophorhabdaceae bacterium]|nr:PAS domain S-box protein [Syntrophorhabdaceae bacterium]
MEEKDITTDKQTSSKNLTEQIYYSIFNNVKDGISQTTPEGRLIAVNPSLANIFGFKSPEEMLESVVSIGNDLYFNPEDRNAWLKLMEDRDELNNYRVKGKKKDGTPFWFSIDSHAIKDKNGRIVYLISTLRDITEQVIQEKKNRINILILQALLDLHQMSHESVRNIKSFIVEKCIEITGSELTYVGFVNEDETILKTTFWSKNILKMCRLNYDSSLEFNIKMGGLWAEPIRQKKAIIVNDYEGTNPYKKGMPEGHIPIKRFMGVPVLHQEKVVMTGCFANKEEPYDEDDVTNVKLLLQGFWNFLRLDEAQKKLQESELRYRSLFKNANDAILLLKDGIFVDCNPKALELFKCERREVIGKRPYELSPPVQADGRYSNERAMEKIQEAIAGKPQFFEWVHSTCDGEPFYTEVSLNNLKIGDTTFIQALVRDITEKKKVEEQIRFERERYALLVENFPYGVILLDKKGEFVYVNKKWVEIFGYEPDEIPNGKAWFKKAYPDHEYRKTVIEAWSKDVTGIQLGDKRPRVFNVVCKDGSVKIISFITVLVENQLFITTAQDITEYKRTEEQFLQAQKMEAIGRLAGGIAHDFNKMLTVILGHAQLGLMNLDPINPICHRLVEIENAAKRSAELTKNLLAFARKQPISPKTLNINNTIEEMLNILHRLIGENIELRWFPNKDLWPVRFDPAQLNQVIMNLIVNARDAIEDVGAVTIETDNIILDEIYCRNHMGFYPGEFVMLAISDNGIGMEKDVLEHIFEPFFTTKDVDKGSGLGLSTVYGIVKQNNGFINAYSEPKKGTTFKIYIPRFKGKEEKIQEKEDVDVLMSKGETILIVEDEKDVLELCSRMLEELGYQVISANSPEQAIKGVKEYGGDIHLLLTDVIMPEMNGKELAKVIKNIKPHIKCLFMSGYTNNAVIHNGIIMDGITYMQKPFSLLELSVKVRQALED